MFNLKNKKAQVAPYEKYLRKDNVGPTADDDQAIWEKELPHRDGPEKVTTTEDQFKDKHKIADSNDDDAQIIEKVLENAQGYVTHRTDKWDNLPVTPMSATVEKLRQNRLAEDYKTEKKPHWSDTFDEDKQQGKLPKWPKNAPQHSAITLNNDPRRFENTEGLPVHQLQSENDAEHGKSVEIAPLVGGITTASIHKVVNSIKSGDSIDFDTAIVAILREAEKEKRELTNVEQKTISELKIARTHTLLQK